MLIAAGVRHDPKVVLDPPVPERTLQDMGSPAEYSRHVNRMLDDAQRACHDDYAGLHRHMEQAKPKA